MTTGRSLPRFSAALLLAVLAASSPPRAQSVKAQDTAKPKPAAAPASTGPALKVVSRAKDGQAQRPSPFLRPPGADRYDDPDASDWADVPAWRQASFFGVRARGQSFVYVVDCSGSMIDEDRLTRAKEEVRRSVARLREPQKFKVIFYNDGPLPMPGDLPRSADLLSKNQLLAWMRVIESDGGTDPKGATALALALRPDAVFLLSDGEFPDGTAEAVARQNPRKIPIHCVDLSGGLAGDQLPRIARESGGKYVSRPWTGTD